MDSLKPLMFLLTAVVSLNCMSQLVIDSCVPADLIKANGVSHSHLKAIREESGERIRFIRKSGKCRNSKTRYLVDVQSCLHYTIVLYEHGCVGAHHHLIVIDNESQEIQEKYTVVGAFANIGDLLAERDKYLFLNDASSLKCW